MVIERVPEAPYKLNLRLILVIQEIVIQEIVIQEIVIQESVIQEIVIQIRKISDGKGQ